MVSRVFVCVKFVPSKRLEVYIMLFLRQGKLIKNNRRLATRNLVVNGDASLKNLFHVSFWVVNTYIKITYLNYN